jgi:hypothetical protein
MARKLTRYKVNRQFRKNPTRSRVFFPYRLPFQRDFRLVKDDYTEVSAATAARWAQVVSDIADNARHESESQRKSHQGIVKKAIAGIAANAAIAKSMRVAAKKMRSQASQSLITREVLPETVESVAFFLSPLI